MNPSTLVIGISGTTCSGKTTLAKNLARILGKTANVDTLYLNQDQFYWDDKDEGECANHVKVQDGLLPNADGWINWELSSAFNNKGLLDQVQKYESDQQAALLNANRQINPGSVIKPGEIKNHAEKLMRSSSEGFEGFSKELERFCTGKSLKIGSPAHPPIDRVIFLDGILLFNHSGIAEACDVKFFIELTKEVCWERRQQRSYDPPDPEGYFEKVVWPYYIRNRKEVEEKVSDVQYLSGSDTLESNFMHILMKVLDGKQNLL